jgi:hypothetical protein
MRIDTDIQAAVPLEKRLVVQAWFLILHLLRIWLKTIIIH